MSFANTEKIFVIVLSCAFFSCMHNYYYLTSLSCAEIVDSIVAVVNDDIVSLYELNRDIKPYENKIRKLSYSRYEKQKLLVKVREDKLNQLIDKKLIDQEIKNLKIPFSEQEVDSAIDRIKRANNVSHKEFLEELAKEGLTIAEYRQKIKEQILRTKIVNVAIKSKIIITQDDIKEYYEKNIDKYKSEKKYHLRNIIMKHTVIYTEQSEKAILKKLEAILKKLKAGASFETMARNYSESSMADEGGDLGLFSLNSLSPKIRNVVEKLKPGAFSQIVDTDKGYQIFYLENIEQESTKSLDEANLEIEEKLYNLKVNEKFESWLKELRNKGHVNIFKKRISNMEQGISNIE